MKFELGYYKSTKPLDIQEKNLLGVLTPNEVRTELTGEEEVVRALCNPIGSPRLSQIVKPGEKIVIITSDITRPMPTAAVLPHVLNEIESAGCSLSDVTIVFALGNHRNIPHRKSVTFLEKKTFSK
jgi:nickel-dependent lactate racemase